MELGLIREIRNLLVSLVICARDNARGNLELVEKADLKFERIVGLNIRDGEDHVGLKASLHCPGEVGRIRHPVHELNSPRIQDICRAVLEKTSKSHYTQTPASAL